MTAIRVDHLHKLYGAKVAVDCSRPFTATQQEQGPCWRRSTSQTNGTQSTARCPAGRSSGYRSPWR
jgi:hypothetical protein